MLFAIPFPMIDPVLVQVGPLAIRWYALAYIAGIVIGWRLARVLVQRTGSEEARARNEDEANGSGPPRRPKRGYHGKRDLTPRDE